MEKVEIQDSHKNGKSRYQRHKIAEAKTRGKLVKEDFREISENQNSEGIYFLKDN